MLPDGKPDWQLVRAGCNIQKHLQGQDFRMPGPANGSDSDCREHRVHIDHLQQQSSTSSTSSLRRSSGTSQPSPSSWTQLTRNGACTSWVEGEYDAEAGALVGTDTQTETETNPDACPHADERLVNYYLGEKYTLRYTGGMVSNMFMFLCLSLSPSLSLTRWISCLRHHSILHAAGWAECWSQQQT